MIVTLAELRVLRGAAWRLHLEYTRAVPVGELGSDQWANECWSEAKKLDALIETAQVVKPFS